MNNVHTNPKKNVPSFWNRLMLAAEAMSESYDERLEKRVSQLEAEVDRLSASQKKGTKP